MSSQKGNNARTRPQKHKNRMAFKNTLHDTNHRTKNIVSTIVTDVCLRCKEIIEWKIKYKKYKPLTQPKTCIKCNLKTVKHAYHVMCIECGKKNRVCTKCCQSKEVYVLPPKPKTQEEFDSELQRMLVGLSERRRRTFVRYLDRQQKEKEAKQAEVAAQSTEGAVLITQEAAQAEEEMERNDLLDKLKSLKMKDDSGDNDDDCEELEDSGNEDDY